MLCRFSVVRTYTWLHEATHSKGHSRDTHARAPSHFHGCSHCPSPLHSALPLLRPSVQSVQRPLSVDATTSLSPIHSPPASHSPTLTLASSARWSYLPHIFGDVDVHWRAQWPLPSTPSPSGAQHPTLPLFLERTVAIPSRPCMAYSSPSGSSHSLAHSFSLRRLYQFPLYLRPMSCDVIFTPARTHPRALSVSGDRSRFRLAPVFDAAHGAAVAHAGLIPYCAVAPLRDLLHDVRTCATRACPSATTPWVSTSWVTPVPTPCDFMIFCDIMRACLKQRRLCRFIASMLSAADC